MKQESHPDTTDKNMRRAAAILHSLRKCSHRQQIQSDHTCPLGTAKLHTRSMARNGMDDSGNAEAEILKLTEEDRSSITWQIAQALFLFYRSTQFGRVATNEIISLHAKTSSDRAYSHTVKSQTTLYCILSKAFMPSSFGTSIVQRCDGLGHWWLWEDALEMRLWRMRNVDFDFGRRRLMIQVGCRAVWCIFGIRFYCDRANNLMNVTIFQKFASFSRFLKWILLGLFRIVFNLVVYTFTLFIKARDGHKR